MFLEILKAILMGIVEGITEWLPISSTGHMILVEQVVKFNASEEFMSMFRVVIQLGAILAVVVLFWNKLWPFGLRHGRVCSKPAVWQLWFKVVAATIPVLIISPLDDWFETRFYNYITVAAMLILYGVLFILVENRRTAPHVTRLEQITYREAFIVGVWQMLAIIPGTSRSGATIVGGLLLGLSRACVAEFTFFLAIPVMAGASLPNPPAARPGGFFASRGNCTGPGLVLYWSHKERTRRRESAAPEIVKNGGDPYGSIDCILHRLPVSCGHQPDRKTAPPVHCGGHQEH